MEKEDGEIREMSIECLGLFCLVDRTITEKHLAFFIDLVKDEDSEYRVLALEVRSLSFMRSLLLDHL